MSNITETMENRMGTVCSTHVGDEKCIKFSRTTLRLRVVDMDGRITLKLIIQKQVVSWTHLAQDLDPVAHPSEHGSEHSGSIKGGEFLA
jgi:hypothetical protein